MQVMQGVLYTLDITLQGEHPGQRPGAGAADQQGQAHHGAGAESDQGSLASCDD